MEQTIVNSIEAIGNIIKDKRFLLVHGASYEQLTIKKFLDGFAHVEFTDFTPNPRYEQVCQGVEVFRREHCELIVAVGGGSAMDVAKCIKLYCRMDDENCYLEQELFDSRVPLIAIPTTAGSGSESTCHAVIYYGGEKQSVSHESILPDYAVLDASVLKNLPLYQKKCTMLDALCHAIESWWSVRSSDESRDYSRKAIAMIKESWEEYLFENTDASSKRIMEAANLAGRAIHLTATTAAHAMSYKITTLYHFPHGHAVAVCLPEVWKYMLQHTDSCLDGKGKVHLKNTLEQIAEQMDREYFCSMLAKMEITRPVSAHKEQDIRILSQSVNPERLQNHPLMLDKAVLQEMYGRIIQS